jgi:prepilin-type processing-associated H-X9-DG protein
MSDYIGGNWLPASELPGGPFWFEKLERYVSGRETGRSMENFACPRAPLNQRGFTRDTVSYGWNERYLPFRTLHSKLATPDETVIIADSLFVAGKLPYDHSDTLLPPQGQLRLAARHRDAANVLFAGGNAASMSLSEAGFEWPRYWDTR